MNYMVDHVNRRRKKENWANIEMVYYQIDDSLLKPNRSENLSSAVFDNSFALNIVQHIRENGKHYLGAYYKLLVPLFIPW